MRESFELPQENLIYLYKNTDRDQAITTLCDKAKKLDEQLGNKVPDQHKLWLIRTSEHVPGCITFESIIHHKSLHTWEIQLPVRYMNTNNGWKINNHAPKSTQYADLIKKVGNPIAISEKDSELLESLAIHILEKQNCKIENHINPEREKKIDVTGMSRYEDEEKSFQLTNPIAKYLICKMTYSEKDMENGSISLMKDPVVLKDDGMTYERQTLIKRYKEQGIDLKEGTHYYPNLALKKIISYLSSQKKTEEEYLEMLEKIDSDAVIDTISYERFLQPLISPSGFSFSKKEIYDHIDTQQKKDAIFSQLAADPQNANVKIVKKDLIRNYNLEFFVSEWPSFYAKFNAKSQPSLI